MSARSPFRHVDGLLADAARWHVRRLTPGELTDRDVEAWADLESRAAEPNAFLSPHFVLPAVRHVDPGALPVVFLVERGAAGGRETVGAGVFCRARGSRFLPLPHLVAYRSLYTSSSGLLLDRDWGDESLAALLGHVRRHEPRCHGIEVPLVWADGPLARAVASASGHGGALFRGVELDERAVLLPAEASPQLLERALGRHKKDLDRRMRRLRERGDVGWRWYRGDGIPSAAVEAFLALEHAGWKGQAGTSLRSRPADEAFFREMVARFDAEGRALFTELTLDGVPIASTSNLVSGRVGFAFKIGWDPDYKAFSPGMLNEVEFVRHASAVCGDLEYFDSGATGDSFINRLWPWRRPKGHVVVPTTAPARVAVAAAAWLRETKRRVTARRRAASASRVDDPHNGDRDSGEPSR